MRYGHADVGWASLAFAPGSGGARFYALCIIIARGHSALCGLYSKRPFPFFF